MYDIGDLRYSIVEPTVFIDKNPGWVLMDGRNIDGTELSNKIGRSNIPDARGVFIRAMDMGRNGIDGKGNPDGDPENFGDVQMDELKVHNHALHDPGHNHGMRSANLPHVDWGGAELTRFDAGQGFIPLQGTGISIDQSGGNETRPRNISVYVYIKVS